MERTGLADVQFAVATSTRNMRTGFYKERTKYVEIVINYFYHFLSLKTRDEALSQLKKVHLTSSFKIFTSIKTVANKMMLHWTNGRHPLDSFYLIFPTFSYQILEIKMQ